MRYYYEPPRIPKPVFGETYRCNHPVYIYCTLFKIEDEGLAVIQQRYDSHTRRTWWEEIDLHLTGELYIHPGFRQYFRKYAGKPTMGLYPTVTIRQIMWALKMKPLKREKWETVFDHAPI